MFACSTFKSGKSLYAFTFNPNTFEIQNTLHISIPDDGTSKITNYDQVLSDYHTWLNTHAVGKTIYHDSPKFGGNNHYYVAGRRVNQQDLKADTKAYVKILEGFKQKWTAVV